MARELEFRKYEGLGNDFILVDLAREEEIAPGDAPGLCDRRRGIGADGVLVVLPPRIPGCDVRMRVLNADGSVPEMCGNGVRCVALHVARARGLSRTSIRVESDAGVRVCDVDDAAPPTTPVERQTLADGATATVRVDMGVVNVLGDRTLEVAGLPLALTLADAGNPHAVTFGNFTRDDVERLGPRVATSPEFPRGTNVEFARARSGGIDLLVWERGVGITLACGTGACATAAVACAKGLFARGVGIDLSLPGGGLQVTIAEDRRATMTGPARQVFSGTWLMPRQSSRSARRAPHA
jgi:diaminopimelate epimerase